LLEEKLEKIGISEKDRQILEIIAKRVGGDFRMEVKLGKPGGGSFFNQRMVLLLLTPYILKKILN